MQSDSMHPEIVVPRMPRLQYRSKLGSHPDSVVNVDVISPVSSTFSSSLASTAPSTPPSSERCPSPDQSLPSYRKNRQRLMASTSSYNLSHNNDNAAEKKPPKKRASSFFNFFTVKEPSQQALEEYQRHLRTAGGANNNKDGRLDTVGLPGISSAKLPPTVPKVNSKWDGVPHQLIKDKESQKQKRNAHLHFHDYNRSLRSSGSERSGSTNTSSSALSRSSSHHHDPPSSSTLATAAGPLQFQNSASSTLSDLYGWETTGSASISMRGGDDGHGTRPGGGKKIRDKSKQKLSRTTSSYLQAPPLLPRSIPDQYLEQNLSDLGALLGPPSGHSSSLSLDLDKQSESPSSGEGLIAPTGNFQNSVIIPPASCTDEPLAASLSSREQSTPKPLALTNSISPLPSASSSNNTTTVSKSMRTTPSPSPPPTAPEDSESKIHPPIIDQAIAPWVHTSCNNSPATAPAHQTRKKKSVREIFSGKWKNIHRCHFFSVLSTFFFFFGFWFVLWKYYISYIYTRFPAGAER